MRIGELAELTGVSERSLRYYEEQGLLSPERTPAGYRVYAESDVDVVRHVRALLAAGLGTAFIREVLPCVVDTGDGLAPGCPELLPRLARAPGPPATRAEFQPLDASPAPLTVAAAGCCDAGVITTLTRRRHVDFVRVCAQACPG